MFREPGEFVTQVSHDDAGDCEDDDEDGPGQDLVLDTLTTVVPFARLAISTELHTSKREKKRRNCPIKSKRIKSAAGGCYTEFSNLNCMEKNNPIFSI